jgi:hypothetical protein
MMWYSLCILVKRHLIPLRPFSNEFEDFMAGFYGDVRSAYIFISEIGLSHEKQVIITGFTVLNCVIRMYCRMYIVQSTVV